MNLRKFNRIFQKKIEKWLSEKYGDLLGPPFIFTEYKRDDKGKIIEFLVKIKISIGPELPELSSCYYTFDFLKEKLPKLKERLLSYIDSKIEEIKKIKEFLKTSFAPFFFNSLDWDFAKERLSIFRDLERLTTQITIFEKKMKDIFGRYTLLRRIRGEKNIGVEIFHLDPKKEYPLAGWGFSVRYQEPYEEFPKDKIPFPSCLSPFIIFEINNFEELKEKVIEQIEENYQLFLKNWGRKDKYLFSKREKVGGRIK